MLLTACVVGPSETGEATATPDDDTSVGSVAAAETRYVAGVPIYSVDGRCLHVSTTDGTLNAVTRACAPGITAETYIFEAGRIKTAQGCLAPALNPAAEGSPLVLQPCNPTNANQAWDFNHSKIVHYATNLCLTSGTNPDGGQASLMSCGAGRPTNWMTSKYSEVIANGLCLDARGGQTADGTAVQLYACNATAAQRWRHSYDNGASQLVGIGGKCLSVAGGQVKDRAGVVLGPCAPTTSSVFFMSSFTQLTAYGPGPNGNATLCVAPTATNGLELRPCALVPSAIFRGQKTPQTQDAPLTISAFSVSTSPVITSETSLTGAGLYVYGRVVESNVSPTTCPSQTRSRLERMNVMTAQWELMWSGCGAIGEPAANVSGTPPVFFAKWVGGSTQLLRVNGTAPFTTTVIASGVEAGTPLLYDAAAAWLYWGGSRGVWGMPADGSALPRQIYSGTNTTFILGEYGSYVFALEATGTAPNPYNVVRYQKSNGARKVLTTTGAPYPYPGHRLFVDPSTIYYMGGDNFVHRVTTDGTADTAIVGVGPSSPAFTVTTSNIFWLDTVPSPGSTLWQSNKDGARVVAAETGLSTFSRDLTNVIGTGRMAWRDEGGVRVIVPH